MIGTRAAMKSRQAKPASSPSAATQPTSAAASTSGQIVALAEEVHERAHAERGGVHVHVLLVRARPDEREAQVRMPLGEQRERAQRGARADARRARGDAHDELRLASRCRGSCARRRARRPRARRPRRAARRTRSPRPSCAPDRPRWRRAAAPTPSCAPSSDDVPRRRRLAGRNASDHRAALGHAHRRAGDRAARAPCGGRRPRRSARAAPCAVARRRRRPSRPAGARRPRSPRARSVCSTGVSAQQATMTGSPRAASPRAAMANARAEPVHLFAV